MNSICGIDCDKCELAQACKGCEATDGKPFGGCCVVAEHCRGGKAEYEAWKESLLQAFRTLGIPELEGLSDLNPLTGSYVNLEYPLPGGQRVKFLNDNKIYLGNQLHKQGSHRCYGIIADETYLWVAEYGEYGADPELVLFKRWNET